MVAGAADAVRRPRGRARRVDEPHVRRTGRGGPGFRRRPGRGGSRAGRPRGHLVRQLRRMDGGGTRPVRRRRGPGAGQHALQGCRGSRRPVAQRRPRPRHRDRLPRDRLRRHARRRPAPRCRRCRRSSSPRGRPAVRRRRGGTSSPKATPAGRAEVDRRSAALGPDDPSDILFTSGTTGVPKGVVMTHGRTLIVATDWVAMTGLHAGDVYLQVNPYFHMFGLKAGILASVASGATMLPEPVFDVDRVLARVAAEDVTVLPGPPTLYQSILDHPQRAQHDLSSLRVAVTGSADIPVELIRRVDEELPVLEHRHRLRAHRGGHRLRHVRGRRRRGRRHHRGPATAGLRAPPGRRRRQRCRSRGIGRGRPPRRQHHGGLSRRPRRDAEGAVGGRLAAHRGPRASWTRRAGSASSVV